MWPHQLRMESSHEEGGERNWAIHTTRFSGNGSVSKLHYKRAGDPSGVEHTMDADLVLLAMGFTGPSKRGLLEGLNVDLDARGNIATTDYQSTMKGIFAAGDARRGQSLVVWAIAEGREAAAAIDRYLKSS
jgi:glutamate synthase (NADPH/NADH) small chain